MAAAPRKEEDVDEGESVGRSVEMVEVREVRDEPDDLRRFLVESDGHDTVEARGARFLTVVAGATARGMTRWHGDGALDRAPGEESERRRALEAGGGDEAAVGALDGSTSTS